MEVIGREDDGGMLFTVSEQGTGRRSVYGDYRAQSRGGYGSMNYRTEAFGDVAAVKKVYADEDVILISSSGVIIRLSAEEIRVCARPSKGVRLMKLGEEDTIIAVTTAKKAAEEDTQNEENAEENKLSAEEEVNE